MWSEFVFVGLREMARTQSRLSTHGSTIDLNPKKNVVGTSRKFASKWKKCRDKGSAHSLTNVEIKTYRSNHRGLVIRPMKFNHKISTRQLGVHDGVRILFQRKGWRDFLKLRDRTYESQLCNFLACFLGTTWRKSSPSKWKGENHRATYEELYLLMSIGHTFNIYP